ncbi:hypothetical protein Pfo_028782 [Paulownia fortunei]|nr:hypothetical protein Pfo_028782 [Paulownia fortunei]
MAARKTHRYLSGADRLNSAELGDQFEFEFEFEEPESANVDHLPVGPKSLPVNIPDWSQNPQRRAEEDDGNDRIPPHEYLARTRVASFSVHEGIGRTLKGRDLSRVRNAIWKQTGFED